MNEVNKTLFIPLYGKAQVSSKGVILSDPTAERIWRTESFPIRGKSKSKWLAYNMAMRARVFDDWTEAMLRMNRGALVLHVGCGLDSRCLRVKEPRRRLEPLGSKAGPGRMHRHTPVNDELKASQLQLYSPNEGSLM